MVPGGFSKRQRLVLGLAGLLSISLLIFAGLHSGHKSVPKTSTITDAAPPAAAIKVTVAYIQAHEDSVGADQTSPTSWLDKIKPLTTASWYGKLQPPKSVSTSNTPYNYTLAHSQGYTVKASVSSCIWDRQVMTPTSTSGAVTCSVYDNTYGSDGRVILSGNLPFGWAATGQQSAAVLKIVLQNGAWRVDSDLTGQGA